MLQHFPTIIFALIAMAFLTLLERKSLSYMQLRKGPNKLSFVGIPQPMADALKLLMKASVRPTVSNPSLMAMMPVFSFSLALLLWLLYPSLHTLAFNKLSLLTFICISALMVYPILIGGWSSNSKYALLGAIRTMAQMISYEIPMILALIFFATITNTLELASFPLNSKLTLNMQLAIPMALVWLTIALAETNRTPFDFAEGESELVSGFNVEYSGTKFAVFFMAEYLNILFMSVISSSLLMNSCKWTPVFTFMFLLARGTFPRHRYDMMMSTSWESLIPSSLAFLIFTVPLMTI
uniref:NADH-ubiquinone oxidoreductase chain 1 n=1 Tax=Utterbackia peninsularis TaxID=872316 RepID=F4ZG76_9BIVA|nr:NADH dehydrogenase subunit 1 [Utterbackia peninsularis]ADL62596.1 NADH dehydrogenase subunit 1 [Utterbackia peninsularis]